MSLNDRDKKIAMVIIPLVLIGAFFFLVMKPKRAEAVKAAAALEQQRYRRDEAVAREQQLLLAKQSFTADYTTVVRLGKAVPTDVDMPSVLVQLERAARGTGIEFDKITPGERIPAAGDAPSSGGAAAGSSTAQPTAAGGAPAQSGPGKNAETANNAAATSEQSSAASEKATPETDTQTSTPAKSGGVPVGGGSAAASSAGGEAQGVPGLDTVPLELAFTGSFFDLSDFFHDLKRFVLVANQDLKVRGRLMTIDSFSFGSGESFPKIEAGMKVRIFLVPEQQGVTGGASPAGPGTPSPSASSQASSGSSPTPTPTSAATPGIANP